MKKSIKLDINFLEKYIIKSYMKQFSIIKALKFIDRTMTNFFFSKIY